MENDARSRSEWIRTVLARFQGPLIRYAQQLTGDLESGRDVVQDTFLKLCTEDETRVGDHLARWLYTVCRNRALDVRRKEGRMKPVDEQTFGRVADPGPSPAARAERKEAAGQVMQLISRLTPNQREVVRLKFQGGLSYKEISQVTGLSVSNVGFLLHQAIRVIRGKVDAK